MVDRRLCPALVLAATVLLAAPGCGERGEAEPDGSASPEVDAPRNTDFRDAGCSGGAGSGSGSGTGSGDGCGSGSGSGAPPDPPPPPCDQVTFRYRDAAATSVWVTGSFTAWATMPPGARALTRAGTDDWSLTTQVGAGRQRYKLVIDGTRWIVDPANPVTEPDGFGGRNSVLVTCEAPR